jgi:2-polyprenyl-3-methyl-5-hydroxy-6-metoxy-1,4-benzoquinol methylase
VCARTIEVDGRSFSALSLPEIHPRVAALLAREARGARLLDLPAGSGVLAWQLARAGFEVTASDLHPERFEAPGIPVVKADLDARLPFETAEFDAATFIEGPEHVENPYATLREFARVLKPGGLLVLSLPNYGNLERRLRFLFRGGREKPVTPERLATRLGGDASMIHRSPMDIVQLRQALELAGFEVERLAKDATKVRQFLLLPLAAFVWSVSRLLGRRGRERYWLHQANAWNVLMGGNTLIVTARRRAT